MGRDNKSAQRKRLAPTVKTREKGETRSLTAHTETLEK